jgi:uncharacterized membrane protein YoaT (DUF817 family)
MKNREEWVRKVLIIAMYLAAFYKLYSLPQTHDIFDAIKNGRDGATPYLVLVGIIIVIGLIHIGINWVFRQGNR